MGGMWSAGDPSSADSPTAQPEGTVRALRNYMIRPNRWDGRPPFVYDTLMSVMGLARWEDLTNQRTSTMAFDATKIYKKPTTGLAWDSGTSATFGTRLTDFANIYGKLYAMFDDGAGTPTAALSYDGTNVSATPFNTPIFARTVTAFIERLFLAYVRAPITNLLGTTKAYLASGGNWNLANVETDDVVAGTSTTGRLTPTNTTTAYAYTQAESVVALTAPVKRVYRGDFQAVSAVYNMPLTLKVRLSAPWNQGQAVSAGGLITPSASNGFVYRADNAGTTDAGAEPVWPTTLRATVVDNGITWRAFMSEILGATETTIVNATATDAAWISDFVPAELPPTPDDYLVQVMIVFGNTAVPTFELHPINFSFRDALGDTNPAKQNYGQQYTAGDFYFPFVNAESTATRTVNLDAIIWSDIGLPKSIRAQNSFKLSEVAGLPTAAGVIGGGPQGRYWVAKRRGFWVFKRTTDRNMPILPESSNVEVGCLGPRAWDTWGKELFWIGEDGVYRMNADGGEPVEFGGEGMREEINAQGADWVESQTTYKMPILAVDHRNKEVWVYTQKAKIYVFHIPSQAWSVIDCPNGAEVRSMMYDTIGKRMLVSYGGAGVTRFMETSSAKDTIANTGTEYAIIYDVIPKAIELFAPRYEAAILGAGITLGQGVSLTGQNISIAFSHDRGVTWTTPPGYPATFDASRGARILLEFATVGPTVMLRFRCEGSGGSGKWSISKLDVKLEVKRGELPWTNAVTV
jgi:hypothetical protein